MHDQDKARVTAKRMTGELREMIESAELNRLTGDRKQDRIALNAKAMLLLDAVRHYGRLREKDETQSDMSS